MYFSFKEVIGTTLIYFSLRAGIFWSLWSEPDFNLRPNSDNSLCHMIDSCDIFDPTLITACVTWLTAAISSARLKELGPMKMKPTLVGFSWEYGSMLRIVLIKTRNAPIPTMKIRQIEYQTGFLNWTLWKWNAAWIRKLKP